MTPINPTSALLLNLSRDLSFLGRPTHEAFKDAARQERWRDALELLLDHPDIEQVVPGAGRIFRALAASARRARTRCALVDALVGTIDRWGELIKADDFMAGCRNLTSVGYRLRSDEIDAIARAASLVPDFNVREMLAIRGYRPSHGVMQALAVPEPAPAPKPRPPARRSLA